MNKGLRWKETIAGVEAPNLMVVETQLPAGRNQTFATPADIVACLKANPEAAGQVLLALESQYIAGETAKHIARASQAEQALATVTAERDEARAKLAEATEWGSRACEVLCYVLGTLNLCDEQHWAFDPLNVEPVKDKAVAVRLLVRDLRAKLAKTARERDDAMTLAEERRDYARAQNAKLSVECDDLRAQLTAVERERDEARAERDTLGRRVEDAQAALNECGAGFTGQPEATRIRDLRARLAESTEWGSRACEVLGYVLGTLNLCDEQHWAFDPLNVEPVKDKAVAVRLLVRDLRAQLAKTERVVEAASDMLTGNCACDKYGVADTCSCAYEREERLRVALRALDSPVVAGTDSGGSGAATPEGGHAAPTGGPMPPPEPAGSSCCPGCACGVCISRFLEPVPPEVHERGWQWRPVGDGAFAPPFGTVRACVGCGCLVAGGPTACARCAQDSPVGVAATACDHKRQRCENDHAVCRDCGAVNRAVTGVVDWGPPETARDDGSTGAVADDQPASARLEKRADGWHYHDAEYPDEGYVGPFSLAIAAIAHAEGGGYLVDGADEHAPVTRAELDELRWRVERLENLTGSGSGSGSGSG